MNCHAFSFSLSLFLIFINDCQVFMKVKCLSVVFVEKKEVDWYRAGDNVLIQRNLEFLNTEV